MDRWKATDRVRIARISGESGQSMVEFALVAPLLIYLLFAITVLGVAAWRWIMIANPASTIARYASIPAYWTSGQMTQIEQGAMTSVGMAGSNWTTKSVQCVNQSGGQVACTDPTAVSVEVQECYDSPGAPFVGLLVGQSAWSPYIRVCGQAMQKVNQ